MRYFDSETITGSANSTVYGQGLTSTEAEKKVLKRIYFIVSARQGNFAEIWKEKERLANIHDNVINLATDDTKTVFEVDIEIPTGQTVKPAIRCGGTATNLVVVYEYEIA